MNPLLLASLIALVTVATPTQAAEPVRFGDALYQKFQHPRCLHCHQFNSRRSNGRAYGSHRSRWLCETCHTPAITGLQRGDWFAPGNERLDYTGLDARNTCLLIKANSGGSDRDTRLAAHMLSDVRIRWGLENGTTPDGKSATVPGGYTEWRRDVQAWLKDGMLCE